MASSCYGRRLSELLQEQQEPFLLLHGGGGATEAAPCYPVAQACRRLLLGGLCFHVPVSFKSSNAVVRSAWGRAARRALRRWDLAGCFPCGAVRDRESFRRLPRAGDVGSGQCDAVTELDDDGARGGRQLSPVSVLDVLHSDEEDESSPMLTNWEDDDEPSTSASSPSAPSGQDLTAGATSPCFTFFDVDKIRATEVQSKEKATTRSCKKFMQGGQRIISSWERIAGDIARIPVLVELDLSSSSQEWRRRLLGEEEESSRVVASVAAMIFEEMRAEAARDMLRSHEPCCFPV